MATLSQPAKWRGDGVTYPTGMGDEGHGVVRVSIQRHDDQPHLVFRHVRPVAVVLLPQARYQHQSGREREKKKLQSTRNDQDSSAVT